MVDGCILLLIPIPALLPFHPFFCLELQERGYSNSFSEHNLGKQTGYLKQTCVLTVGLIGGMRSNRGAAK